jgi:hypothetical protein
VIPIHPVEGGACRLWTGHSRDVIRHVFVITVAGEMDEPLREEFEDVEPSFERGVTRLRVVSADPSVLHGVLNRVETMGLELLAVRQVEERSPDLG